MNPYPQAYPQQGYGYPPMIPPPNPFYAPPRNQQYNGYPATSRMYEPARENLSRRYKTFKAGVEDDESRQVTTISQPTRPRKNSLRTGITPDYIFVSLSSHDTLKVANLTTGGLLDTLRDLLLPAWKHGVASQSELTNGEWVVKFLGGDVWSATGAHGIMARRLVSTLFAILAEEGFGYLATVDIGNAMKTPRMVFTSVPPDPDPHYFMISFSTSRRTVTIIDAPEKLAMLLCAALRATETSPFATAPVVNITTSGDTSILTYTHRSAGTARQDLSTLMSGALRMIAAEGFRFEASVPLGKVGLFGLRGRREVWMFRRIPLPPSATRRR